MWYVVVVAVCSYRIPCTAMDQKTKTCRFRVYILAAAVQTEKGGKEVVVAAAAAAISKEVKLLTSAQRNLRAWQ